MNKLNPVSQKQLTSLGITVANPEAKKVDVMLAVHIAVHSSLQSMNHLSELLIKLGKGTSLEKLRIHKTKCSKLVLNVVAPAMLAELVQDIKNCKSGYSLIVDESTDLSNTKLMGSCVRFYSHKLKIVTTEFLGFIEVTRTTAQALSESLLRYLGGLGLDTRELSGLGTDGANAMCGKNNSLYTILKEKIPTLQLVKCICHSLNLCSSKAAQELPSALEFLIRESRSWFAMSPLRQSLYSSLYAAINDGKPSKKLVALSGTRWLAMGAAVNSILGQWVELRTHFKIMAGDQNERCHMARILSPMYKDDTFLLYLIFLRPILEDVNKINLLFQSEKAEITKVFEDLRVLVVSLARRIIKPAYIRSVDTNTLSQDYLMAVKSALLNDAAILPIHLVDFGELFSKKVRACNATVAAIADVKQRCLRYLVRLCRELANRLPDNLQIINALQPLSPSLCLRVTEQPPLSDLPLHIAGDGINLEQLHLQWKKLPLIPWVHHFNNKVPTDTCAFWSGVLDYTNADGKQEFKELSTFALKVLSLPVSHAVVERVFSVMNAVKTKARNSLSSKMMEAILRIRMRVAAGKCCTDFEVTDDMLKLFTSQMYASLNSSDGEGESSSNGDVVDAFMEGMDILAHEENSSLARYIIPL